MVETKKGASYDGVKDPNFMSNTDYVHSPDTKMYTPMSNGGIYRGPMRIPTALDQVPVTGTTEVLLIAEGAYGHVMQVHNGSVTDNLKIQFFNATGKGAADEVLGNHDLDAGQYEVLTRGGSGDPIPGPLYAAWSAAAVNSWVSILRVKYGVITEDNDGV